MDRQPRSACRRSFDSTLVALAVMLLASPQWLQGQNEGQAIFETTCIACHSLAADRLVGPGLLGVSDDRDREWLLSFITEPDRMLAEGDSIAVRLLAEYLVPMPNMGTTRSQAEAVLDYIDEAGAAIATAPAGPLVGTEMPAAFTDEQARLGQSLFQGTTRFENGGPTCNACHEATHEAVIGGGSLAVELTTAFSRLSGPGVRAILSTPPFPVMQVAYADRPLTEDEVIGLVAFLEQADAEQALHQSRNYGLLLLSAGAAGSVLLLAVFSTAWRGRRRESVNQGVFDRQTSTN